MEKLEITDGNFEDLVLKTSKPILILFSASWCQSCKMVDPVVDMVADDFKDIAIVGKMDVDSNAIIPTNYGIRNLPALIFFKNGEVVDKIIGAQPKSVISKKLEALV